MSSNHGRACARESDPRREQAVRWLAAYDPGDGKGWHVGDQAGDEAALFTQPVVIAAYLAGMDERLQVGMMKGDDAAWAAMTLRGPPGYLTREDAHRIATVVEFLWNDMGEARRLIEDAACLFRCYGKHHREQADALRNKGPVEAVAFHDRVAKATRNEAMAARLEAWLKGDPDNPAEVMRKISESMVDGVKIKGVDHQSFDAAAAYLEQPVVPSDLTEDDISDRYESARRLDEAVHVVIDDGGTERHEITPSRTRRPAIVTEARGADGSTLREDMQAAVDLTSRPMRPYGPAECDFPGQPVEINWVTSRERAQRIADLQRDKLKRTYSRTSHPLYEGPCLAEPPPPGGWPQGDPSHTAEACRDRFENVENFGFGPGVHATEEIIRRRERNIDWDLYARLTQVDRRSWLEKATDWVANLLNGRPAGGYAEGGFVKADAKAPDLGLRDGEVRVQVSPPERLDTAGDTATLRLQTADPRFDPTGPVLVNGFPYRPATKGQ